MRELGNVLEPVVVNDYSGFVGLNTHVEDFSDYVMLPADVKAFFANEAKCDALFAYPKAVANGFDTPPVFAAEACFDKIFTLRADIETNQTPKDCLTWFASKLLPDEYLARDRIEFAADAAHGFGPGTCRVTTLQCLYLDGREAKFAKKLIAVEDRPALFLKIRDHVNGGFHDNVAIFFPDKATGATHKAVEFGEAFLLAKQGNTPNEAVVLTPELQQDIITTFNLLVNTSLYKTGNNLYSTTSKLPIESALPQLIYDRNRLD